jgi:cysteine desulfurase
MLLGMRTVYLDHNATTPVAREVQRAMERALSRSFGNPSSLHIQGRVARGLVDDARKKVAALLGCAPEEVVFTSGGTEGNNAVIKGAFLAAQAKRGPGNFHIVTSRIEHDSILGACKQVEVLGGRVTYVPAGRDGVVNPADIEAAIGPETILVSIMHANNETGAVQPIEAISRIAHARGVPLHTDAVQSYGKIRTRVDELGCDFLTLTAHKINGPKGAGALYVRGTAPFFPLISGGDQERGLRTGTEAVHQIVGLGVAAELCAERMQEEFERLRALRADFLAGLRRVAPGAVVHEAPPEKQLPGTLNIAFPGEESMRLLAGLDCYEVSVSVGSACTADRVEPSHVLLGMGIAEEEALASIRMSMGTTTTARDMRYVLEVLEEVLKRQPAGLSYLDPQHLDEARIRSPQTFLVDLRFPHERMRTPSIPGAREWHVVTFDMHIAEIPRDKEVILMCGTGVVSYAAGYRLANAGHPRVRVVQGGYAAWRGRWPGLLERLQRAAA